MKKSERVTKANKATCVVNAKTRLTAEEQKGSTGVRAKGAEIVLRDMLNAEGIAWTGDFRARHQNREDIAVKDKNGVTIHIEVKHGGGALAYASQYDLEVFDSTDRDLCLKYADYVAYYKDARKLDLEDRESLADQFIVSTKEDFLDMLEEYCRGKRAHGWDTAVRLNSYGEQISIQGAYAESLYEGLESELGNRTVSLREFCSEVLGREPRMHW